MAFNLGEEQEQGMNEMNLIPLIDIMLVLMIIFLVTATIINPSIPLTLPKTDTAVSPQPPEVVTISIDARGQVSWNQDTVSLAELASRMSVAAQQDKKPTVQIRADKEARYDTVAQVMARASKAGLSDLAFISEAP
ncbi:ExbD/TolR family protein [Alkanindiges sp. WGS2144]|uniref:ExbD/TolR family protein n=1 Tax=Alkanindiges sp. WGS2144 TaxID=3366808 RepID=UPI003752D51A